MRFNQKGFSAVELLIVLVIVGLVGLAAWFVYNKQKSQNQTNTAPSNQQHETNQEDFQYTNIVIPSGWKSYENKEYGFSFQYPANFSLSEDTLNPGESSDNAIFVVSANPSTEQGVGGYEVRILKSNLHEAVKNDGLNVNENQYKSTINEQSLYVSGHEAIELSYIPDTGKVSWFFIEKDNDTVIRFALVEDSGVNAEESKAIYNSLVIE